MMDRRTALFGLGSVAIARPTAARAQQQPLPVIGFLSAYSPDAFGMSVLAMVKQGLAKAGFIEGQSVAIETRWAEGHYERLPAMAADLVRHQVKVISTTSTPPTFAAKAATTVIPIVFALAADPVALGFVASLARPGGNLTGATRLNFELAPKRLQLMHELVPLATSMALLINPDNPPIAGPFRQTMEASARTLGLKLHVLEARDARGIEEAFAIAVQRQAGALIIAPDAFFTAQFTQFGELTVRHRLPTLYSRREFVTAGGLMSYSGNVADSYHIAGQYIGRILKGEEPADLAVQQSTKIEMFLNLKTAKSLGLTVPPLMLAQADEAIE